MYEGKRLITPETIRLSRPDNNKSEKRRGEKWASDSGEGIRFAYSDTLLPEKVESAHFESGPPEVIGPDPNETFALPFDGPYKYIRSIVARRRNENHGDQATG